MEADKEIAKCITVNYGGFTAMTHAFTAALTAITLFFLIAMADDRLADDTGHQKDPNYAHNGEPEWQPIKTAPRNGRFFIAVDAKNSGLMAIGNHPVGCSFGYWIYDRQRKEWMGSSAQFSGQSFTHWRELPAQPPIED